MMNIDLSGVTVGPLDDGASIFEASLHGVLDRIAPLAATAAGMSGEERIRRLCAAINLALDSLEGLTGMSEPERLPALIERVSELTVTGDNVEVQIGAAGDLRVDKCHRLVVDEALAAIRRSPVGARPAALRETVATLQRLLALLLLHGWADEVSADESARQAARHAIVDVVQGRHYYGQPAV